MKSEGPLPLPTPCHLSLSWTTSNQCKSFHLTAWRSIVILSIVILSIVIPSIVILSIVILSIVILSSTLRRGLPIGASTSGPSTKSYDSTSFQGAIIWVILSRKCYINKCCSSTVSLLLAFYCTKILYGSSSHEPSSRLLAPLQNHSQIPRTRFGPPAWPARSADSSPLD